MNLDAELRNEWYKVDYLRKKVSTPQKSVSVIIPTFNRAPYDPTTKMGRYNPLDVSIRSILSQENAQIKEVIVVDGQSNDYTRDVIKQFRDSDIEIVYIEEGRKGPSNARNVGIEESTSDFVYFTDDDCVTAPFAIYGALYYYTKLNEKTRIGAILLPLYQRSTRPQKVKSMNQIGVLDLEMGIKTGNFDAFPIEYLEMEKKFIDEKNKILKPVKIKDLGPIFIGSKNILKSVGGFPNFPWTPYYGEHTELACNLVENGYGIFLTPDPKFQTIHIRFGYKDHGLRGEDWYKSCEVTLNDLIEVANRNVDKPTGFRLRAEEWYETSISSYWAIFYKRSEIGARRFLNRIYKEFVVDNSMETYYPIKSRGERERIFSSAVNRTQKILEKI